jgi:hypothetical protein
MVQWARFLLIYTNLKGILPWMMQICVIIYTFLAFTRMAEILYACHCELFNEQKWSISSIYN